MSIKLSKGEAIVKQYDYSKTQSGALGIRSHLIVTNKRVIEEKVCDAKRNERVIRSEMPIEQAQYVKTRFRREGNALWIVMAVIGFIMAIAGLSLMLASGGGTASLVLVLLGLILGAGGIVLFIFIRKSSVYCIISSDKVVVPTMALASNSKRFFFNSHVGTNNEIIQIVVDPQVAYEMVNEIGAAILDARNYVYEEPEEIEIDEEIAE